MAIAIGDVPKWCTFNGISHAVGGLRDGFAWTACGSLIGCYESGDDLAGHPGKRICRKCRKRLSDATLCTPEKENKP